MQNSNDIQIINQILDKALINAMKKSTKETALNNAEIKQVILNRLKTLSKSVEGNKFGETYLSLLLAQ